eukprot:m.133904 g.133904  ORF g.133904 m.133904 type:complete len:111 (+) comp13849_c0_seq3:1240-1572(+)
MYWTLCFGQALTVWCRIKSCWNLVPGRGVPWLNECSSKTSRGRPHCGVSVAAESELPSVQTCLAHYSVKTRTFQPMSEFSFSMDNILMLHNQPLLNAGTAKFFKELGEWV